jgi:hypothetical protein
MPAAGSLDDHQVGVAGQLPERLHDWRKFDADAFQFRRNVGRRWRLQAKRIHRFVGSADVRRRHEPRGVRVLRLPGRRGIRAGSNGLHHGNSMAGLDQGSDHGGGDHGLADFSVGAGDEHAASAGNQGRPPSPRRRIELGAMRTSPSMTAAARLPAEPQAAPYTTS